MPRGARPSRTRQSWSRRRRAASRTIQASYWRNSSCSASRSFAARAPSTGELLDARSVADLVGHELGQDSSAARRAAASSASRRRALSSASMTRRSAASKAGASSCAWERQRELLGQHGLGLRHQAVLVD